MYEAEELFKELGGCPDYFSRLIFIKDNSKKITGQFIDIITLHAKVFLDEGEVPLAIEMVDLALVATVYIDDPLIKASSLVLKSQLMQVQNNYMQSKALLLEAEEIYKKEKAEEKLCDVYNLIAYLNKSCKKYDEAIEYYKKAIDLSKKLNKKDIYGLNLSGLAEVEYYENRPQQALWCFEQAMDVYRTTGEIKSQVQVLNWIGYIQINLKIYDSAVKNFNKVLELLSHDKDNTTHAIAYAKFHLGAIYQHLNKYDISLKYFFEALQIWKKRESLQAEAEINFYWGKIHMDLGLKEKGAMFFNTSLKLLQKISNKKGMLALLQQIKNIQNYNENEPLQNFFAKNLKVKPQEVTVNKENYFFNILSFDYKDYLWKDKQLNYFTLGTSSYQKKINISKENPKKHIITSQVHPSVALRQIITIYNNQVKSLLSIPYIVEFLELKEKIYNPVLTGQIINGLYYIPPFKEEYYIYYIQEIVKMTEKFVSKVEKASIYYETALIYYNWDKYDTGENLLFKALDLSIQVNNKELETKIYRGLSWCELRKGETEKTIAYLNEALRIDNEGKTNQSFLDLLMLKYIYLKKNDFLTTIEYHARAKAKSNEIACASNPLLLLRSVLLKSSSYYQLRVLLKIIYEKKLDKTILDTGGLFEKENTNIKEVFTSLYKKISNKKFLEFFSNHYMALMSLFRKNIYEGTHYILKSIKSVTTMNIEKDEKILLLRMGLIFQTLEMNNESRWQLRIVDEYFRELFKNDSISPFLQRSAALFNISILLSLRGQFNRSLTVLGEAEDIEEIEKKHFRLGRIYYQKGLIYEYLENFPMAIVNYNKAINIFHSLEDNIGISRCLNKLAILTPEKRKDYLLEAMSLVDGEKDPLLYGQIIFNWAAIIQKEGNFLMESLDALNESLKYFQKIDCPQCTVKVLYALTSISIELGQEDIASSFLNEAMELLKGKMSDVIWEKIRCFILMGKRKYAMNKKDEALRYFQEALFCSPSIPSSLGYSYWTHMEMAQFFTFMGDKSEMEKYANRAKEIKREIMELWGDNAPLFLDEKNYIWGRLKSNSFDMIDMDEEDKQSEKTKSKNMKEKILPLLYYLLNLKENESLIRRYTSEIITNMENNQKFQD